MGTRTEIEGLFTDGPIGNQDPVLHMPRYKVVWYGEEGMCDFAA